MEADREKSSADHYSKKPKTTKEESCNDTKMNVVAGRIHDYGGEGVLEGTECPQNPWTQNRFFADTVQLRASKNDQPHYYMGEDEEECYPRIDELFCT